jgi:uncharacterized membrane protein
MFGGLSYILLNLPPNTPMMDTGKKREDRFGFRILLQYFLQGLLVMAPVGITFWVVISLFNVVDSFLPNIIHNLFPDLIPRNPDGTIRQLRGVGFVVVILFVLLVGWMSSLFIFNTLLRWFDMILERTPGIKFIYSSIKDFLKAFAGNKKKFDKPVLVCVDDTDIWRIGFITQKEMSQFDMPDHVTVYVPLAYAVTGATYIVPKDRIKPLEHISASEAMRFAVTGGVTEVHEQE